MQAAAPRDEPHRRYLDVRTRYEKQAYFVHSDLYGPAAIDLALIAGLSIAVGYLMSWQFGTDLLLGFVPVLTAVLLLRPVAHRRAWKYRSVTAWANRRFEPVRIEHEDAFKSLLSSRIPPDKLDEWKVDHYNGKAFYQITGFRIVYDAEKDDFQALGAGGFHLGNFRHYIELMSLLRQHIRQAGLCGE